jgi:hypothetical protein
MSCKDCEQQQDAGKATFYRWGTANILLSGCNKHLRELFDALNTVQQSKGKSDQ